MSIFENSEQAEKLLRAANVFYIDEPTEGWGDAHRCLNMNDTFCWASAYGPEVEDKDMVEVAELFWRYGLPGLHYWCVKIGDWTGSQFEDVQRGIDFVRHEEELRLSGKTSSERAFHKMVYTLGKR